MKLSELHEDKVRNVATVFDIPAGSKLRDLDVSGRQLTSLEGCPESITGTLTCRDNLLTSLEGAPPHIGGNLNASNNRFTNLHNIHKHIKHIGHTAHFGQNPITSHILGVLLIDGLQMLVLGKQGVDAAYIVNKHLKEGRDIMACQEELLDAGFDEFAQL